MERIRQSSVYERESARERLLHQEAEERSSESDAKLATFQYLSANTPAEKKRNDSFMCVTWLLCVTSHLCDTWLLCVTWLLCTCYMTPRNDNYSLSRFFFSIMSLFLYHVSFSLSIWRRHVVIHTKSWLRHGLSHTPCERDMRYAYVWHDYSCVWHDYSFVWHDYSYVRHDYSIRVTWPLYTCDMTSLYLWHDPLKCVTLPLNMCAELAPFRSEKTRNIARAHTHRHTDIDVDIDTDTDTDTTDTDTDTYIFKCYRLSKKGQTICTHMYLIMYTGVFMHICTHINIYIHMYTYTCKLQTYKCYRLFKKVQTISIIYIHIPASPNQSCMFPYR